MPLNPGLLKKIGFPEILQFFLIFTCVVVLLSAWLGIYWRNSIFIFFVSIIISYFLFRKFYISFSLPRKVLLLSLLVFIMASYPLLILHPFYPASTDTFHAINMRVIDEKIPETYTPYSDVNLNYQLGFHLFAKIFSDFLFFVPDYIIIWFFGAVFAALQLILLYLFASEFFGSERAGLISALLFIGTKIVFQNMYYGMYPWLMGTVFFLFFALLVLKRNKLGIIFLPAIFTIHPGVAFYSILYLLAYFLYFRESLKQLAILAVSLILAIPAYFQTYEARLAQLFSEGVSAVAVNTFTIENLVLPFMWTGIIPTLFFIVATLIAGTVFLKTRKINREQLFVFLLILLTYAAYAFFKILNFSNVMGAKISDLFMISVLLFSGFALASSRIKFFNTRIFYIALVILGLVFFLSSSYLTGLRDGIRITPEEAEFALLIKDAVPEKSKIIYLTDGGGKMAMLSDTIPYNALRGWFVAHSSKWLHPENFQPLIEKDLNWEMITQGCLECIPNTMAEYAVINEDFFPHTLQDEEVLTYKKFKLYKLN